MLGYMPEMEREEVLRQIELKCVTANTIGSLRELKAELLRVRKNGHACDMEENELHIRCFAAPILDYKGEVHSSSNS